MIGLLSVILILAGLLMLVPTGILFVEVLAAIRGREHVVTPPSNRPTPTRLAVLIPAHDEASVIASTVRSLRPQLTPTDRLLVIADNCSDQTAAVARSEGAEVIDRNDKDRRGKGFALQCGVDHLRADAPEIVVVVDADCQVQPGCLAALAACCISTSRPVQALYRMLAPPDGPLRNQLAGFAWVVRNHARPVGLQRLGLPCQLMGTGMAFPWSLIADAKLATPHLVEDMKLGLDLARAGRPPTFCSGAQVVSYLPNSPSGLRSQRTRWEHGHLGLIFAEVPRLLTEACRTRNLALLVMALDVSVPPLALLSLTVVTVWLATALIYLLVGVRVALILSTTSLIALLVTVLLSWHHYGRGIVPLRLMLLSPLYVLAKVPLYARFLISRQRDWVRSKRD